MPGPATRAPCPGSPAAPSVLKAVTPRPGEEFDPGEFLTDRGTLYVLGTAAGAGAAAALVAALVEDMVETARRIAAASPGVRLDPPLLLALDEIGNLAPLPSLPALMSEGGGTGITTLAVLQSLSRDPRGGRTASWNTRRVPVMDSSRLRTLPFSTGVLPLRSAPPIVLDLDPWTGRRGPAAIAGDLAGLELGYEERRACLHPLPPQMAGDGALGKA
jgi:hypothetical protein